MCLPIAFSASIPLSLFSASPFVIDLPAAGTALPVKLTWRDMIREDWIICAALAVREKDPLGPDDVSPAEGFCESTNALKKSESRSCSSFSQPNPVIGRTSFNLSNSFFRSIKAVSKASSPSCLGTALPPHLSMRPEKRTQMRRMSLMTMDSSLSASSKPCFRKARCRE